jgi:hypothetical protein
LFVKWIGFIGPLYDLLYKWCDYFHVPSFWIVVLQSVQEIWFVWDMDHGVENFGSLGI